MFIILKQETSRAKVLRRDGVRCLRNRKDPTVEPNVQGEE